MLKNNRKNFKYKSGLAAFAGMAILMLAASCSNDEPILSSDENVITFTTPAQIFGASSRVDYNQTKGVIKVTWKKDDVVQLFSDKEYTNAIATFVVESVNNNIAKFTCKNASGITDATKVSGYMKYMPELSSATKPAQGEDPYAQAANGSMDYGNQDANSVKHLRYNNVIYAELNDVNFTGENPVKLDFKNSSAIFRIIFKAPRTSSEGASLTMYGADGWGVGIPLTLDFPLTEKETIVAYIAAPSGTSGNNLNVVLTDGAVESVIDKKRINKITTFSHESKSGMTYVPGNEYTADFTNDSGDSWDAEIDGDNEFVNLGLSVLWSIKNLGAKALTGDNSFGYYYAWGIPNQFTDENYPPVVAEDINPYNKDLKTLLQNKIIASVAYPDGKNVYQLAPKFDAATYYYYTQVKKEEVPTTDEISNSAWFTPTREQFEELLNKEKCTWVWNAALKGYEVVSKMQDGDKYVTLFMPAAGFKENGNTHNIGHYAYYWTSTPPVGNSSDTQNAWCMHISGAHRNTSGYISEDL